MKATLKNAAKIYKKIQQQYEAITTDSEQFYNLFHDDLMAQKYCAFNELNEMEYYLENADKNFGNGHTGKDCAENCFKNIEETLIYCKAVIKLQDKFNKLPKSIYIP